MKKISGRLRSCRFMIFEINIAVNGETEVKGMRYFTDEQLKDMKERVKSEMSEQERSLSMAYISRIEVLDKRNDEYGDCREELMKAISQLEQVSERYIHRGRADPNDEDADAFEYENYDFRSVDD